MAAPAADARTIALLQRARRLGVTSFDVGGASNPERAERLIARAFPGGDPAVVAVVGRSTDSLSREPGPDPAPASARDLGVALARSLERSRRRLAPVPIAVVDWEPDRKDAAPTLPRVSEGSPRDPRGPEPHWALRLTSREAALPTSENEWSLFSGMFSILDPSLGSRFEAAGPTANSFLIARDPFSEGRLDGSRFVARTALAGPASPPVDVRRLHEEFDPVLPLGFLTADRRRTLAQAALQFVLRWPWVASAVVPLPQPERFDEVLGFDSTPSISPDDLELIRRLK